MPGSPLPSLSPPLLAGVSTIARTLVMVVAILQGIAVNGVLLADYSLQSLRGRAAYVSQNVPIFVTSHAALPDGYAAKTIQL